MNLPLYDSIKNLNLNVCTDYPLAHTGLIFDKFVCTWLEKWKVSEKDKTPKKYFYNYIISKFNLSDNKKRLEDANTRRKKMVVDFLRGRIETYETQWRMVSGLGAGHPFETGFIWHRTLGAPYLPGSSIKGMIKAWATQWSDDKTIDIARLFGLKTALALLLFLTLFQRNAPH